MILRLLLTLLLLSAPLCTRAVELPGIPQFIDEMVEKHQFNRDELVRIFQQAQHKQGVLDAISKPATAKPCEQNSKTAHKTGSGLAKMHDTTLLP